MRKNIRITMHSSTRVQVFLVAAMTLMLYLLLYDLHTAKTSIITNSNGTRFLQQNLDLNTNSPCGLHKCFYRLQPPHSDIGYLVTNVSDSKEDFIQQWETTKFLEHNYGIRHFLLEPPTTINITQDFATALGNRTFRVNSPFHRVQNTFGTFILYQKSKVAPALHMLFGCGPDREQTSNIGLQYLLDGMNPAQSYLFAQQVQSEIQRSLTLFRQVPWLARDFQVIIDEHGNFFHIDVWVGPFKRDKKNRTASDWGSVCEQAFAKLTTATTLGL